MTSCGITGSRMSPRLRPCALCSTALLLLQATSQLGYPTYHYVPPREHLFCFMVSRPRCVFPYNHPSSCERCVVTDDVMWNNGGQDVSKVTNMNYMFNFARAFASDVSAWVRHLWPTTFLTFEHLFYCKVSGV